MGIETSVTKGEVSRTYYLFDVCVMEAIFYHIDGKTAEEFILEKLQGEGLEVYELSTEIVNGKCQYCVKIESLYCVYEQLCCITSNIKHSVEYDKVTRIYTKSQEHLKHVRVANSALPVRDTSQRYFKNYARIERVYRYLIERMIRGKAF